MLATSTLFFACGHGGAPETKFRSYGTDHAWLHFERYGGSRGTEDIFIDSFGRIEARSQHVEVITPEQFRPTVTYSVRHNAEVTIIDSVRGERVLLKDRAIDSMMQLSDPPTPEDHSKDVLTEIGYEHVGDTTIFALPARIWKMKNQPNWLYEWHALIVGTRIGSAVQESGLRLLSVDTVNKPDPSRFRINSNYPIRDLRKENP